VLVLQSPQLYFRVLPQKMHLSRQVVDHVVTDINRRHNSPYLPLILRTNPLQDIPHKGKQLILRRPFNLFLKNTQHSNPKLDQHLPPLHNHQVPYLVDHPFRQLLRKQRNEPVTRVNCRRHIVQLEQVVNGRQVVEQVHVEHVAHLLHTCELVLEQFLRLQLLQNETTVDEGLLL
jgi:hypothetical protein